MNQDDLTRRARRRVGMKLGFAIHLTVFVLVNSGLWLLGDGLRARMLAAEVQHLRDRG